MYVYVYMYVQSESVTAIHYSGYVCGLANILLASVRGEWKKNWRIFVEKTFQTYENRIRVGNTCIEKKKNVFW